MFLNILEFERMFNAFFSYHTLEYEKIESKKEFEKYINNLRIRSYMGMFNKYIKSKKQSKKIKKHHIDC